MLAALDKIASVLQNVGVAFLAVAVAPFLIVFVAHMLTMGRGFSGGADRWLTIGPGKPLFKVFVGGFCIAFLFAAIGGCLQHGMSYGIRRNIRSFVETHKPEFEIRVNGLPVENDEAIRSALETIQYVPAHHSHPIDLAKVEMIAGDGTRLTLWIGRDSRRPREHWVYDPAYRSLDSHDVGRIDFGGFEPYTGSVPQD